MAAQLKKTVKHTIRKEARVEALSATANADGATAVTGSWALDEGDTVSPGTTALSALSVTALDVTGNSGSSAP